MQRAQTLWQVPRHEKDLIYDRFLCGLFHLDPHGRLNKHKRPCGHMCDLSDLAGEAKKMK